jgi:hypothetical protein
VLVERLRTTERRRRELTAALESHGRDRRPRGLRSRSGCGRSLADWRSLFTGDVAQARQGFRQLLTTPILLTPFEEDGRRGIRFEGRIGADALLAGEVTKLASPTGFEPVFWP